MQSAFNIRKIMFIQSAVCLAICILYIITPCILEDNYERIKIENFFLLQSDSNVYPIIFVYCYDGYYGVHETLLDYNKLGCKRYFFDAKLKPNADSTSLRISNERLTIDDFINKYLIKQDDAHYYTINNKKYGLFTGTSEADIKAILFAAQYNYNFLILAEYGRIHLYLPKDYPRIEQIERKY